jgi:hypothetical protein
MIKKISVSQQKKAKKLMEQKANKPSALKNPKYRAQAIYSFCHECIYDPGAPGSWRKQVEECTSTGCPLYNFRPLSVATFNKNKKQRKNK